MKSATRRATSKLLPWVPGKFLTCLKSRLEDGRIAKSYHRRLVSNAAACMLYSPPLDFARIPTQIRALGVIRGRRLSSAHLHRDLLLLSEAVTRETRSRPAHRHAGGHHLGHHRRRRGPAQPADPAQRPLGGLLAAGSVRAGAAAAQPCLRGAALL